MLWLAGFWETKCISHVMTSTMRHGFTCTAPKELEENEGRRHGKMIDHAEQVLTRCRAGAKPITNPLHHPAERHAARAITPAHRKSNDTQPKGVCCGPHSDQLVMCHLPETTKRTKPL